MSSYYADTIHPDTGAVEEALWSDDYFGPHRYGVMFPDGKVFRPEECTLPDMSVKSTPLPDLKAVGEAAAEWLEENPDALGSVKSTRENGDA